MSHPWEPAFLYRESITSALIGNKWKIFIQPQKNPKYLSRKINLKGQVVGLVLGFRNIKHFHFEFMIGQKLFLVHRWVEVMEQQVSENRTLIRTIVTITVLAFFFLLLAIED